MFLSILRLSSYVRQMQLLFCLWRLWRFHHTISDLLRTTVPWIVCCEFTTGDSWDECRQEQSSLNTPDKDASSEKCTRKHIRGFVASLLGPRVKLTTESNTTIKTCRRHVNVMWHIITEQKWLKRAHTNKHFYYNRNNDDAECELVKLYRRPCGIFPLSSRGGNARYHVADVVL